jgi:hypothetical protein
MYERSEFGGGWGDARPYMHGLYRRLAGIAVAAMPNPGPQRAVDGVSGGRGIDDTSGHDDEALRATAAEFVQASDAIHETHGSTAVHGGIGGSTVTAHCAYVCDHPGHVIAQDRFDKARYELGAALVAARSGGTR